MGSILCPANNRITTMSSGFAFLHEKVQASAALDR